MAVDLSMLPSELVSNAQPLIGFAGLEIQKNQWHKSIWDSFNNRKLDREAIQFKLLPYNYEFPISKPKRQSYEWYTPKGILKRNWMLKHLHVLPAVVVLFQDIEWNDEKWTDKQMQCKMLVQSLKNSLQGRNTRIAIVLIQKGTPLPQNEELLASERAANLTNLCDINAKLLFVLPYNDHLMGNILRLESAFLELAQSYYTQMAKQVRMHRDQLTNAHLTLKIRHQFKLGFISELKLDFSTALKHYTQAYSNLDEIRVIDTNCLEIKTIAGFINYKMCKLLFKLKAPRDSIQQFKTHIDKYKPRAGFKDLLFEHYGWLSVQYGAFAELFCDAIKNGLPALQTQHPGIYYHKAAEYITKRKEAFRQCCALSLSPTESSPSSASSLYSDFFGIRGKSGEPITEQQIISMVQENEKLFNHSMGIITLLGQAMAQYKIYKCLRFRKKLAIDMAEEYLNSGDHSKALTLYSLMLSDYRSDKWQSIFTEVLQKTLRSAYLSASVVDFVFCSIETLSHTIAMDKQERINVLENLWKVFQSVPPGLASQIAPELRTSWESALKSFNAPIKIDLDKLSDLLDCKVTFENRTIKHDEKIQITLYIRSTTEVPLKLKNFAVILTDTNVNVKVNATKYSEYSNENEERLKDIEEFLLESDKCYKIHFSGDNYQFMENVDVQILKIEIQMGSDKIFAILTQKTKLNVSKPFKAYNPHKDCMESIPIISWCYITPTFHLSAQTKQNNQPMLTNEFYKVTTKIFNSSDVCLQNVGACISVPPHFINKAFLTTDLMQPMQKINSNIQIDIGELQSQSESKISYYVTSLVEGNVELKQKLFYQTENPTTGKQVTNTFTIDSPTTPNSEKEELAKMIDKNSQKYLNTHNIIIEYIDDQVKKIKEDTIIVPCIEELRVVGRFYTLSREALLRAYRNEDFLLRLCLEVKAPDAIDILESVFITDHNLVERPYKGQPNVYGSHLKSGTKFEDIKILNSCSVTEDWVSHDAFFNDNNRLIFKHDGRAPRTVDNRGSVPFIKNDESFNRNLLLKIPSNATIISSNMSTTSLTGLAIDSTDDLKIKSFVDVKSVDEATVAKSGPITRNIYNCAIDGVKLTSNERNGFITAGICAEKDINVNGRIFGVYCVKWRRSGSSSLNESKFVINGIEIIEPPLNLYCYVEEKMYVRVPMTLKITLRNPTRKIIHLQAILNGSDSFMYSGHRQLNVSIFSYSTFELSFMLYPLKAGWQPLPELLLEYINYNQNTNSNISQQQLPNVNEASPMQNDQTGDPGDREKLELTNLVKRWMPKMVFIHPPQRHLQ